MTTPAGELPTCPRHPDRVSYVRCQRCGRPVCPECQRPAAVGIQCVDCVREAQQQRGPVRSRLGFVPQAGPPIVTYVIIGLNVLAYLYGTAVLGQARWLSQWGLYPNDQFAVFGLGTEWYRWILAAFAHVGLWHIGMNMLALWQLGNVLEPALGRGRFIALYALSMIGSSAAIVIIGSPAVGASGAIFGLLAAYAVILRRLQLPITSVVVIAVIFIGGPLLSSLLPGGLGFFSGISWQGHLGGAIVGAITMLAMFRGVDRRERERVGA